MSDTQPVTESTSQESGSTSAAALVEPTPRRTSIRDAFDDISAEDLIGIQSPNSLSQPEPPEEPSPNNDPTDKVAPVDAEAQTEGEDAPTKEADSEPEKKPEKPKIPSKRSIKAVLDDNSWEVPADAKVEYKVNGQQVTRTIKEILEIQSGIDNTDRYYQKLQKDQDNWKGYITNIYNQAKEGKGLEAITKAMADLGQDPIEFRRSMRQQLLEEAERFLDLPEEQRRALELEEENEYYRNKSKEREAFEAEQRQIQEAVQAKAAVEARYKMPPGEWERAYEFMVHAQKQGQMPPGDITIEQVGQFYQQVSTYQMVNDSLKELAPHASLSDAELKDLASAVLRDDLTREELDEIVKSVYPAPAEAPKEPMQTNSSEAGRAERNLAEKLATTQPVQSLAPKSDEGTEAMSPRRRPRDLW